MSPDAFSAAAMRGQRWCLSPARHTSPPSPRGEGARRAGEVGGAKLADGNTARLIRPCGAPSPHGEGRRLRGSAKPLSSPPRAGKWTLRSVSEAGADGAAAAGCGETLVPDTAALKRAGPSTATRSPSPVNREGKPCVRKPPARARPSHKPLPAKGPQGTGACPVKPRSGARGGLGRAGTLRRILGMGFRVGCGQMFLVATCLRYFATTDANYPFNPELQYGWVRSQLSESPIPPSDLLLMWS